MWQVSQNTNNCLYCHRQPWQNKDKEENEEIFFCAWPLNIDLLRYSKKNRRGNMIDVAYDLYQGCHVYYGKSDVLFKACWGRSKFLLSAPVGIHCHTVWAVLAGQTSRTHHEPDFQPWSRLSLLSNELPGKCVYYHCAYYQRQKLYLDRVGLYEGERPLSPDSSRNKQNMK